MDEGFAVRGVGAGGPLPPSKGFAIFPPLPHIYCQKLPLLQNFTQQSLNSGTTPKKNKCIEDHIYSKEYKKVTYLRTKLFGRQLESSCDLFGKYFSLVKPKRIQTYFSNHCIIWYHHCHWAEQCLQKIDHIKITFFPAFTNKAFKCKCSQLNHSAPPVSYLDSLQQITT